MSSSSTSALLEKQSCPYPTGDESHSWAESAEAQTPQDPVQAAREAAAAAATKDGPAAHEITVHRAVKLSCERSFNASSSFVHFAHHGLQNVIDDRNYLETRGVRNLRQRIRWYESPKAVELRKFLRSRCFAVFVFAALFVALFFPDLFVLLQVPSNEELDAILTTAFVLFVVELLGLLVSDPSYPLSFFFIMDLLGTFSMCFDISFALGPDASMPEHYTENKKGKFLVLRAAKAARLGARAGRLSRVVKILRFLNADDDETDMRIKIAKVISNKLSDVLSIRVAFLTICMAVVLPTVQMFEYPEMDESMIAWTQMITADVQEYEKALAAAANRTEAPLVLAAKSMLSKELARFGRFYDNLYGPFKACVGHRVGERFKCEPQGLQLILDSQFVAPRRRDSILELNQANVQVFYDMSTPHRMEAAMSIGLICFTILVMVVFSLVLSSNISVIALTPLERMLFVVRERCKQIFKFTRDLQEDREEGDEEITLKSNNEFALLEKAVSKLVAIAALSSKTPDVEESRRSEHRAVVMGWMQGGEVKNQPHPKMTKASESAPRPMLSKSTARLGSFLSESADGSNLMTQVRRIPHDISNKLYTTHFDSLTPSDDQKIHLATYIVFTLHGCSDYVQGLVSENVLMTFVIHAESLYPANPFHNFAHALDVAHTLAFNYKLLDAGCFFTEAEQFWLVIAALGHDLGHVGLNNQFLVETAHELAVTYNDTSPLENMHCSKLFQIISEPGANVFHTLARSEYKEVRKGIINAVLHTDITKHNEMVKGLSLLYQMHSQVFEGPDGGEQGSEVLSEHSQLLANTLLHCSDIGNPMKPWELCRKLARLVLSEYFAQGDREKELGIPVQMLNDREKVSIPNSQIGFSEFMLAPMVEAIVQLMPQLDLLALHLGRNIKKWAAEWLDEASPSADAAEKVKLRVQKVVAKCEALVRSGETIDDGSRASRSSDPRHRRMRSGSGLTPRPTTPARPSQAS